MFFCAAGSFAIFSAIFNYLPFRLYDAPFNFSTTQTTMVYLVYVIGIFTGPVAGHISHGIGSGNTLIGGTLVFGVGIAMLLIPDAIMVISGLIVVCAGFFTVHAGAIAALNRKLDSGQGRANALYVLFYYIGGWLGISIAGFIYREAGWSAVIYFSLLLLLVPLVSGFSERKNA